MYENGRLAPGATAGRAREMPLAGETELGEGKQRHVYAPWHAGKAKRHEPHYLAVWVPGAGESVAALQGQDSRLRVRERA